MHTIHIDWRNGTSMTTFGRPYYIYVVFHYRYDDIMCSIRTCSHLVMTSYSMFALFYNLYIFLGLIYDMMINMHLTMDACMDAKRKLPRPFWPLFDLQHLSSTLPEKQIYTTTFQQQSSKPSLCKLVRTFPHLTLMTLAAAVFLDHDEELAS